MSRPLPPPSAMPAQQFAIPSLAWAQQFNLYEPISLYYLLVPFRGISTFGALMFTAPIRQALPRVALGLAFLLVWPELLATRLSLAADRGMDSKRAWAYAGLALYAAGLLSLVVGIATPWSLWQPPGFDSFGPMDGGFAGLLLRGPACFALFETLLAGLTLPYVRVRNLRGLARGNDVYPAVNGPALVQQPYSDHDEEARQEGLGAACQDRGSLGDIFAFQALEEAHNEEGSGRA